MGKIKDIPIEERPREKAYIYGLNRLSNAELLAIVLSTGTKEKSALELAYEMISTFHGIYGVLHASMYELTKVKGISKAKAIKLKSTFVLYERAMEANLLSCDIFDKRIVANYFKNMLENEVQESCSVCVVDKNNKILSIKELFKGTKSQVAISPQLVIKNVIGTGNRFYLIHNHPSDQVFPSGDDLKTTDTLELFSLSLDINFIDHLIIGTTHYYSIFEDREYTY